MVEQISTENTKKLLIEGNGDKAPLHPQRTQIRKKTADVVVENATEKRYLWTARAFAIVFAVSLCCNLILIYAISTTLPLYRVEPYLLSFTDKEEQIYNVEPVKKIYDYKYLTELFVREYVILRNTFVNDVEEMERRWGPNSTIREMSSNGMYKKFRDELADKTIEQIRRHNLTRDIKIISVTEVSSARRSGGGFWWQVEFRASDMSPKYETPRVSVWVASIRVGYVAKKVKFNERLKNPLGFTVVDYRVEQRK